MLNSTLTPVIIAVSGFVVTFLVVWCGMQLYQLYAAKRLMVEKIANGITLNYQFAAGGSCTGDEKKAGPNFLNFLSRLGKRFADEKTPKYSVLRNEFLKAGIRNPLAVPAFWGVKLVLMAVLPLCFFMGKIALFGRLDQLLNLGICCGLALAGLYAPDFWLRLRIASRKSRISRGLPDAMDMMVVCVEAGLGLDAALSKVADEICLTCKDLSDELRLYNLEMRAGNSRHDALKNLIKRTELEEIQNLVNLLIQTDRFGTSLAQGLRIYSESFRTKRFMRAEETAATLPTKLMLPVLLFIFPSLFVVIALPAAIRIYHAFVAPAVLK